MENKSKYTASFTGGALLFHEFKSIIAHISDKNLFTFLEKEVKENKFLGIKTESARKRIVQEMMNRVVNAPSDFWIFYMKISDDEQKLALFYLCLKTYYLLFDFHFEVTVPKWRLHANELDNYDIRMRFDRIASTDETVYNWTVQTKEKVISRYFGILTETGLLRKNQLIKPLNVRKEFWQYFLEVNEPWFIEACFYNYNEI